MRRRTVRGDTLKTSAASSIVRSLVTGTPRAPIPVVREAAQEAGLCGGLRGREVISRSPLVYCGLRFILRCRCGFALATPIGSCLACDNSLDTGAHEPRPATSLPFGIEKAATDAVRFAEFGNRKSYRTGRAG